MRTLLVKLTSMGDLIHVLPALSDAAQAIPGIRFDWVADEVFAEIATWHPSVDRVIKTAHRRWKKDIPNAWKGGELKQFWRELRQDSYDAVIDAQGNIKSAVVAKCSRGVKHGMDGASVREYSAHWAYQHRYPVSKQAHAIVRLRCLLSQALGYSLPDTAPDFGIDTTQFVKPSITVPDEYLFFIHNATWETKLWPEAYWQALIDIALNQGKSVLLPCGNQEEFDRAQRLAKDKPDVIALPRMRLSEVAYLIQHAEAAVAVDTGLSHLAGALELPMVSLYGATDAGLIGAPGSRQKHLQADFACAPCYEKQCTYQGVAEAKPACFAQLPPAYVWEQLQAVLA